MPITPIYSNGSYGTLIAAIKEDGQRVDRIFGDTFFFTPPPADFGSVTKPHPDFPDLLLTIDHGEKHWPTFAVPTNDPRYSEWAALVADGDITPEMLADIPEPVESVVERLRAQAQQRLRVWWCALIAVGATAEGITVSIDKENGPLLQTQANSVQLQMMMGNPPENVQVYDIDGKPHTLDLNTYLAAAQEIQAQVTANQTEWNSRIAALEACTTPADFAELGW
jgi:hypothetical protein